MRHYSVHSCTCTITYGINEPKSWPGVLCGLFQTLDPQSNQEAGPEYSIRAYVPRPRVKRRNIRYKVRVLQRSSVGRRETRPRDRHSSPRPDSVAVSDLSVTDLSVSQSQTHFIRPVQGAKTKGSSQEGRIEAMLLRCLCIGSAINLSTPLMSEGCEF